MILGTRCERTGGTADLEDAIRAAQQAVDSTPEDHPDQAGYLNNLENMLSRQHERTSEMADLEDAIRAAQRVVESTPEDHPERAVYLSNLEKSGARGAITASLSIMSGQRRAP